MFPKGLILAVSIGIISGPLFGIFLYEFVVEEQLVYVDDNEWHLGDIQRLDVKLFFANWGYSGKQVQHSFKAIRTLKRSASLRAGQARPFTARHGILPRPLFRLLLPPHRPVRFSAISRLSKSWISGCGN